MYLSGNIMEPTSPTTITSSRWKVWLQRDASWSARLNIANTPGWQRTLARIFAHSGDSWLMIPVMGLFWLVGDGTWKWRLLVLFLAMCITAVLAVGLKRLIGRQRPEGDWGLIYRSTDPHSFPSGHAARLFMMAVFSLALGSPGLMVALWFWAPLVALARVAMGVHYLSDVLGGALLGFFFGILFILVI
jgi:membrane-associated phospholipid phosphatase